MPRLHGTVIAFDLDNTLYDPAGRAYQETVREFLAAGPARMDPESAYFEFERMRKLSEGLESLGLRNPSHERGNADALAAYCLTAESAEALRAVLGVQAGRTDQYSELLSELAQRERSTRTGPWSDRLVAEQRFLEFRRKDARCREFAEKVVRLSEDSRISNWSSRYSVIESDSPIHDPSSALHHLKKLGATLAIITEGRHAVQFQKIRRLGLEQEFAGGMLVTECASELEGCEEFAARLDRLLAIPTAARTASDRAELERLWYFECIRREWSRKTPSFFARCLHALFGVPSMPETGLRAVGVVSPGKWPMSSQRFVMVGDRYDLDVRPLLDLLGRDEGLAIRLLGGKYTTDFPEADLPEHLRPHHTLDGWRSVERFLAEELRAESVPPIVKPPPIVPPFELRPDVLRQGIDSPFDFVRTVARAVAVQLD